MGKNNILKVSAITTFILALVSILSYLLSMSVSANNGTLKENGIISSKAAASFGIIFSVISITLTITLLFSTFNEPEPMLRNISFVTLIVLSIIILAWSSLMLDMIENPIGYSYNTSAPKFIGYAPYVITILSFAPITSSIVETTKEW